MKADNHSLTAFIQRTIPVGEAIAASIASNFEAVTFTRNEFILKQGKIAREYMFLETGYIRVFTFDTEGLEVTTNFYNEESIVFEVSSFFKKKPTNENIQALAECTCWTIQHDAFQVLFHSVQEFREFGRANLVNGFIALKERTLSMINLTAEQRYENLLATRPDIIQNASLKHIASFLGITDTSLSRIRKEFSQK